MDILGELDRGWCFMQHPVPFVGLYMNCKFACVDDDLCLLKTSSFQTNYSVKHWIGGFHLYIRIYSFIQFSIVCNVVVFIFGRRLNNFWRSMPSTISKLQQRKIQLPISNY
jgi:hypothetical protein